MWATEVLAGGPGGPLKMVVQWDEEPGPNEIQSTKTNVQAAYRRQYKEWAETYKVKTWELPTGSSST